MVKMQADKVKADFKNVLKKVQKGEDIIVTYGKDNKQVAIITSCLNNKKKKRKLGLLEGKGKVIFKDDFKMDTEELLNS